MQRDEHISALIGGVYDATLDPSLWPDVLKKSAAFVRGYSAALYSKDGTSDSGTVYYDDGGIDPHYKQLYFEKYVRLDPTTSAMLLAEIGEPMGGFDLIPYEELVATRFYREWVEPQGMVDSINAVLDRTLTSVAAFVVFLDKSYGTTDDKARQRMRLITPHIRRAVLISRVIELKTTQADTFAEMLDGLSAGMFLVDASGRIVHANAAARAMLEVGNFLRRKSGRLAAADAIADQALKDVFAAAGVDDRAVGTSGISVPLNVEAGQQLVAHALPLTSGVRRDTGNAYKAVAALFVHKAAGDSPAPPKIIAETFRLTPMELRVWLAVVEVGGVGEVSEALGISDNTVKTHLKRLYAKTGAGRQADLVKLVAKFSSPLVGSA
jgi:DNA-binding CsgD family transcriptional regulator/PAS domain-containing protein